MKKFSRIVGLCLVMLLLLPLISCAGSEPTTLAMKLPREDVRSIKVVFRELPESPSSVAEAGSPALAALLDALYGAPNAALPTEAYAPELRASHRLILQGSAGNLTVLYDEETSLAFVAQTQVSKGDKQEYKTFLCLAVSLGVPLTELQAAALVPAKPTEDAPLSIDALLRGEIVEEELQQPGTGVSFETFSYNYTGNAPLYGVLTYRDGVPDLANGYLLLVATPGQKPTGGYEVDIASLEENESYYIVRVMHDSPVEGVEVSNQPATPVAAIKVDARRMQNDKIIVFLNEKNEILSLAKIDRVFFSELPADMPPLEDEETETVE